MGELRKTETPATANFHAGELNAISLSLNRSTAAIFKA